MQNILDVALLKAFAHRIGITSVKYKDKNIVMRFKTDAAVNPDKVMNAVQRNGKKLGFAVGLTPSLTYKLDEEEKIMRGLVAVRGILKEIW